MNGFKNGSFKEITINTSLSANTLVSRMITVLCVAAGIYGLIRLATGVIAWLEASGDDNTAAQSKASKQISTGIILCAAGIVVGFIFK